MANQKITEVNTVNALNTSDSIFVNSTNTLRQIPIHELFANRGGISMDVLWENPDPTASFAQTTITLSNTANIYIFLFNEYISSVTDIASCICYDDDITGTAKLFSVASSASNNIYTRHFEGTWPSVTFNQCYRKAMSSTSAGSAQNSYLIPIKVIGLSFGLNNFGLADYIIEQGTKGMWTYRKWNSGIAECWGTYSGTISPYASNMFLIPTQEYPFTFIEAPVDNATIQGGSGIAYKANSYGYTDGWSTVVWSNINTATIITARVHVIGRWK